MNFTRMGAHWELSDCGRYTVAACANDGIYLFSAWRIVGDRKPAEHLGVYGKASDARACCKRHRNRSSGIPELDLSASQVVSDGR